MKSTKLFYLTFVCLLTVVGCACSKTTKNAHNSSNSLDWAGIYTSVVPCADCEGIQTTVVLNQNMTYQLTTNYLGRNEAPSFEEGSFKWDKTGGSVVLSVKDKKATPSMYKVGENTLVQLDMKGNRMEADVELRYTLVKVSDVVEKYWKLVELNGKPIDATAEQTREPHLILKLENNRVVGNAGCNSFNGSYIIQPGNRITFSKMASTMMACMDMETEMQFLQVLEMADNYTTDGETLSLNRARMAPLARFVAVYL